MPYVPELPLLMPLFLSRYDLVHNQHLGLHDLEQLYLVVKQLADGVIPNEYGLLPKHKLVIGAKIARRLLGKVMIDLMNTIRDSDADGREGWPSPTGKTQMEAHPENPQPHPPYCSDAKDTEEEDGEKETQYRLDPR